MINSTNTQRIQPITTPIIFAKEQKSLKSVPAQPKEQAPISLSNSRDLIVAQPPGKSIQSKAPSRLEGLRASVSGFVKRHPWVTKALAVAGAVVLTAACVFSAGAVLAGVAATAAIALGATSIASGVAAYYVGRHGNRLLNNVLVGKEYGQEQRMVAQHQQREKLAAGPMNPDTRKNILPKFDEFTNNLANYNKNPTPEDKNTLLSFLDNLKKEILNIPEGYAADRKMLLAQVNALKVS